MYSLTEFEVLAGMTNRAPRDGWDRFKPTYSTAEDGGGSDPDETELIRRAKLGAHVGSFQH